MRKIMKGCCQRNVLWWAWGLVLLIFCIGCGVSEKIRPHTPEPSPQKPTAPMTRPEAKPAPVEPPPVSAPTPTPAPAPPTKPPMPTPPAKAEPPAKKTYLVHTVKFDGETVSIIAGWYTGDIQNWKALAEANPNIDAWRIFPGNKILIPEDLLKTRDPMPKEFVDKFYKRKTGKAPTAKPPPPPAEEERFEPFGPKGLPQK